MIVQGNSTVEIWASKICKITGHLISPQAVQGRIQYPQVDFCKELLAHVIKQQIRSHSVFKQSCALLKSFKNVLVEDSSCISLPKYLFKFFPGSVNQTGNSSSARIQLRMEIKSGTYHHIILQGYRDNDQKFAPKIIEALKKGDLVIRDLGYFAIKTFKDIINKEAFFLNRYFNKAAIYDEQSGIKIDLAKEHRSLRKKGIHLLDKKVLLGTQQKVPVRIIAIKAPQNVEQQRKRKIKTNRNQRAFS